MAKSLATMTTVMEEVLKDLRAQREIGVAISEDAFAYVINHSAEMAEYRENGMKIHEISDLVVSLISVRTPK